MQEYIDKTGLTDRRYLSLVGRSGGSASKLTGGIVAAILAVRINRSQLEGLYAGASWQKANRLVSHEQVCKG